MQLLARLAVASCLSVLLLWANDGYAASDGWQVQYDFESQAVDEICGKWDAAAGSKVTAEDSYSGPHGCRLSIEGGTAGWATWGGVIYFPSKLMRGDQLWIRVRMKMPLDFDYGSYGEGERLKFLRISTFSADGKGMGNVHLELQREGSESPFAWIYEEEQVWSYIGQKSDGIQRGTWETYELYMKFDNVPATAGGAAQVKVWKNGRLLKDIRDRITLNDPNGSADNLYFFTYWNGRAPKSQFMFVDDVVLQSAVPSARDADGFPFIGADATSLQRPAAPTGFEVTHLRGRPTAQPDQLFAKDSFIKAR